MSWTAALGGAGTHEAKGNSFAALARHGHRVPRTPAPRMTRWSTTTAMPVHLDLAIAPVSGGPVPWLYATLCASAGTGSELRGTTPHEPIAAALIAPEMEDNVSADARFQHWLDKRIEQAVRGVATWM